jgi:hypothetical protein
MSTKTITLIKYKCILKRIYFRIQQMMLVPVFSEDRDKWFEVCGEMTIRPGALYVLSVASRTLHYTIASYVHERRPLHHRRYGFKIDIVVMA